MYIFGQVVHQCTMKLTLQWLSLVLPGSEPTKSGMDMPMRKQNSQKQIELSDSVIL